MTEETFYKFWCVWCVLFSLVACSYVLVTVVRWGLEDRALRKRRRVPPVNQHPQRAENLQAALDELYRFELEYRHQPSRLALGRMAWESLNGDFCHTSRGVELFGTPVVLVNDAEGICGLK